MVRDNKLLSLVIAITVLTTSSISFGQNTAKLLRGKWKLAHEFEDGQEVRPKHEHMTISFNKKNEYKISAAMEETHQGTYTIKDDGKTVILKDKWNKEEKELGIQEITKAHILLENYDGEGTVIEVVPLKSKKRQTLNHQENLLANRWTIFKSTKSTNLDMVFEFKPDHTFVAFPYGHKIPSAKGEWKIDTENQKVMMDAADGGEHIELDIKTLNKHNLVLHNAETGTTNHFHDEKLTSQDPEVQARVQSGRKEMIKDLEENAKNRKD